ANAGSNSGTVTVTENLPSGLTLVSMAGTGWACPSGGNTCQRNDLLPAGASSPQINVVTVSGGGSPQATASDPTYIVGAPTTSTLDYVQFRGSSDPDKVVACSNANGTACSGSVLAPG